MMDVQPDLYRTRNGPDGTNSMSLQTLDRDLATTDMRRAPPQALDTLFRTARTHFAWLDREVPDHLLREAVELALFGPTAANSLPLRVVFVRTEEGKAKLKPTLAPGNVDKTMSAPATAILAHDTRFYEHIGRTFPHADMRPYFEGNADDAKATARQSATLQAGYLILALRALGLDTGPMGGFDAAAVDAAFFPEGTVKTDLLVNIGYGDASKLFPRSPRLDYEDVARTV